MKVDKHGNPLPDDDARPAPTLDDDDSQQIEIDDKPPAALEDKVIDVDDVDAEDKEFKELDHKKFAALRVETKKLKQEREELARKVAEFEKQRDARPAPRASVTPPVPNFAAAPRETRVINGMRVAVPQTDAEWNLLAKQDWKIAVDLRNTINNEQAFSQYETQRTNRQVLSESKERVLQRYPGLSSDTSEETKLYNEVLDMHPEYLTLPKGPIFAMRDMEELAEERGIQLSGKKTAPSSDAARVASSSAKAALTAGGRYPESQGRRVVLTKDELEFCKEQGIKPEDFARERLNVEASRKGVQL